ncbi:NAD-dependent protein deacetylase [Massilia cavernae]|uniref:protein acetyllysine N-acetyltransferase n=1 Tax=Massilia cavernae TaxID=2320864 RepID=A0A418Y8E1_9BURK|nr:NAD-dependent protein deacetylase [Massilia cavernae]RJG27632.1 NAD-dependent protein deacetylase [Massilia cavernae]
MAGDLTDHDSLERMAAFLQRHQRVLVLTGAGISTGSGIPGYRDEKGVRRGTPPTQGPEFRKSQAARKRYWARSMVGYPLLSRAQPNDAHLAVADLTRAGVVGALITQNVDGLHQRAGSIDVLELHGNIHGVVCLDCHARFSRAFVQSVLEEVNPALLGASARPLPDGDAQLSLEMLEGFREPACVHCGGTLKPDVVFFGDGVPAECTTRAVRMMDDADALMVVGSSLMVFSGFRFCRMAAQAGKPIAAVNLGKTRADDMLSVKVEDAAERFLPRLRELLGVG